MTTIAEVNVLDRMVSAVEKVRERLLRATGVLDRLTFPIDQSWVTRYPPELAERLQLLIDTPEG